MQIALRQVPAPDPGPEDVVVAVRAAGICGSDVHGFTGSTGRRVPPLIMGHEFCGRVAAVGPRAALGPPAGQFQTGDRVVVQPLLSCGRCASCLAGLANICPNRTGIGMNAPGGYAEAVSVPHSLLYRLPESVAWEHGALVEPLAVGLRAVHLTPPALLESLVIVGAGTIGLMTLLAARLKGAGQIFVSDVSEHRLGLARRLGADVTINVRQQDPLDVVRAHTAGEGARAAIEAVGSTAAVQQALAVVGAGGHITWIGNAQPEVTLNMQQVVTREITIRGSYGFNQEFGQAIDAIAAGRVDVAPLIEVSAPLEDGPRLFHELAAGRLDAVKVVLRP